MHTFTVPILAEGPLLPVLLGLSTAHVQALRNAGQPIPGPMSFPCSG